MSVLNEEFAGFNPTAATPALEGGSPQQAALAAAPVADPAPALVTLADFAALEDMEPDVLSAVALALGGTTSTKAKKMVHLLEDDIKKIAFDLMSWGSGRYSARAC